MPRSKRSGGSKWAKFIAGLSRLVGDVGHAEDLAQALYWGALGPWPEFGVPDNAEALADCYGEASLDWGR